MDVQVATAEISVSDGRQMGPWKVPANLGQGVDGSIHDDSTAQRLGFRGGTVAGSIHMQQFPPMLVRTFGESWFERGSISTYFRNATVHGEPIRPRPSCCTWERRPVRNTAGTAPRFETEMSTWPRCS